MVKEHRAFRALAAMVLAVNLFFLLACVHPTITSFHTDGSPTPVGRGEAGVTVGGLEGGYAIPVGLFYEGALAPHWSVAVALDTWFDQFVAGAAVGPEFRWNSSLRDEGYGNAEISMGIMVGGDYLFVVPVPAPRFVAGVHAGVLARIKTSPAPHGLAFFAGSRVNADWGSGVWLQPTLGVSLTTRESQNGLAVSFSASVLRHHLLRDAGSGNIGWWAGEGAIGWWAGEGALTFRFRRSMARKATRRARNAARSESPSPS